MEREVVDKIAVFKSGLWDKDYSKVKIVVAFEHIRGLSRGKHNGNLVYDVEAELIQQKGRLLPVFRIQK